MNCFDKVYVITAPSGTGKTTINRKLVREIPDIEISTSYTTRKIRPGEANGDHYWFIGEQEMLDHINGNKMLEWAEVFGRYYGTSYKEVERILALGRKVILEIDVQGWMQVKANSKEIKSILILPPSVRILKDRLESGFDDDTGDNAPAAGTLTVHCFANVLSI